MLDLCLNTTLSGLLLQQSFYASSGGLGVEKQHTYANNDQLIKNLYFNDNTGYDINKNSNNNSNSNNSSSNSDISGKSSEIVDHENHGIISAGNIDNQVLNSSFDLGSHLVDSQWSLEEFLLGAGGGVVNGPVNQLDQPRTYPNLPSSSASSPCSSSRGSPPSPQSPQSPQSPHFLQSPQSLRSPASSTSSGSLDDILDDLEIRSPYGSPPTNDGFLVSSTLAINSPFGSPMLSGGSFANSPYSSSSSSVSSPSGLGSPYGSGSSYGSPASAVDPLEEILGDLTAPLPQAPVQPMEYGNQPTVIETTTTEVLGSSYPSLTAGVQHGSVLNERVVSDGCTLLELLTNCNPAPIPHDGAGIPSPHTSPQDQAPQDQATVDSNISLLQLLQPTQTVKAESDSQAEPTVSSVSTQNQSQPPISVSSELRSLYQPYDSTPVAQPASISSAAGSGGSPRYAPYKGKPRTEAQKERKKEHNRKSASKYRSKKKQELEVKTSELELVEERNVKLKANVEELRKEIDYLKTLMLDVIKARIAKKEKEEKKVTSNGDVNIEAILLALAK